MSVPLQIVMATRSHHKAEEIQGILIDALGAETPLALVSLNDAGVSESPEEEDLEPFETFEENALSKARYFAGRTGMVTLADDSGLTVDALEGRPGVRTKRFANLEDYPGLDQDQANNEHLLARLADVAATDRGAAFVCVAALVLPDGRSWTARGEVEGRIAIEPDGTGGFGYDPIFEDLELGRTFGTLSPEQKNERSHRSRAFRAIADKVRTVAGSDHGE